MNIEKVGALPPRSYGATRLKKGNRTTDKIKQIVETMEEDTWYVITDCPYNNPNDYYRNICQAARKLDFPINIRMREGNIYIRRTR